MNKEEKEKIKDTLIASPMFQLSLSSKELFHSNYLSWLAENHKTDFIALLKDLLPENNNLSNWTSLFLDGKDYVGEDDTIVIKREKDNLDFCVWKRKPAYYKKNTKKDGCEKRKGKPKVDEYGQPLYEYTPLLVLENKVKSVIYKDQLIRYKKKLEDKYEIEANVDFVLLSLADVSKELGDETGWHIISYDDLRKGIENTFLKDASLTKTNRFIIEDYCKYIEGLHNIAQEWYSEEYLFTGDAVARSLRLGDIRQKIIFSKALNIIHKALEGFAVVTSVSLKQIVPVLRHEKSDYTPSDPKLPLVFTNMNFMHGSGLLELKFLLKENAMNYLNVIQIQDGCLRYGVEYLENKYKSEHDERIIRDLDEAWCQFIPQCKEMEKGHFGTSFFYFFEKLTDSSIQSVKENIIKIMDVAQRIGIRNYNNF